MTEGKKAVGPFRVNLTVSGIHDRDGLDELGDKPGGVALERDDAVDGPFDRIGGKRRAVGELEALAELEGVFVAGLVHRVALGKPGMISEVPCLYVSRLSSMLSKSSHVWKS